MLNRLAAYLLRCNPLIRSALCQTYSHVFLDEFQDTTASQWDLVHAAFCESQTILTAVGDSKQRIMVWAGAKTDVFETFQREFSADQKSLSSNYRSVPELVEILQRVANMVERGTVEPRAPLPVIQKSDACAIYEFPDSESEAIALADMIAYAITTQQAQPRDFCILTRQRTSEMIVILQQELAKRGITLRDESTLQDVLAEPVMGIIVSTLQLATHKRNAQAWTSLLADISYLSELDPEDHGDIIEQLATEHKQCAASWLREGRPIRDLPLALVNILGMQRYQSTYRQYANVAYLLTRLEEIGNSLQHSFEMSGDIQSVPDMLLGTNVVPAMTIHKSKGLEFKTVIFLGLEDRAWWGFSNQPEEEKRAFFVAFSRAIQRVVFTYAARRKTIAQSRQKIDELYNILQMAGVGVVTEGPPSN
jgi:superfamily I DNA/RNA helicase